MNLPMSNLRKIETSNGELLEIEDKKNNRKIVLRCHAIRKSDLNETRGFFIFL